MYIVSYISCVSRFSEDVLFFKQKTAYEMRISDWSSNVCSSDLGAGKSSLMRTLATLQDADGGSATMDDGNGGSIDMLREKDAVRRQQIGRASCRESVCQYV